MALPYRLTKWNGAGFPTEQQVTALLASEGAMPALRADPPGLVRQGHRYAWPVTFWVISGALAVKFRAANNGAAREVVLRPGDRLDIKPKTWFGMRVAGAAFVVYAIVTPFCLPAVGMAAPAEQPLPEKRSA